MGRASSGGTCPLCRNPVSFTATGKLYRHRELCPQCKADLFRFMAGQPVIDDSELASRVMGVASPQVCRVCGHKAHDGTACRQLTMPGAPGDVDECGCLTAHLPVTKEARSTE